MTLEVATLEPFVAHTQKGPVLPAPPAHVFDPQRVADAPFLKRLLALDGAFFLPRNQAMPSWVLYDCALAPGIVAGLCAPARDLPEILSSGASDDELVPVAMVSFLPLPFTSRHLVHTLAWHGDLAVGRRALAVGLSTTGLRSLRVTAGWSCPELGLFSELGPLRLLSAWTPAHDVAATATFDLDLAADPGADLGADLGPPPEGVFLPLPDAADEAALQHLQDLIESGHEVLVRRHDHTLGVQIRSAAGPT